MQGNKKIKVSVYYTNLYYRSGLQKSQFISTYSVKKYTLFLAFDVIVQYDCSEETGGLMPASNVVESVIANDSRGTLERRLDPADGTGYNVRKRSKIAAEGFGENRAHHRGTCFSRS